MEYHDNEWGYPAHDDRLLFEYLVLDSAQAGLSWLGVLMKREGYRRVTNNFDAEFVARYTQEDLDRLAQDAGIIRNRAKIRTMVTNARTFLAVQEEFGSFDSYVWRFVDGAPLVNHFDDLSQIPAVAPVAETLSRDLCGRGFKFFGPTIAYAFMQGAGLVNDHLVDCFRRAEKA
jgi:DNA-3-methyladenine glycosylase I